MAETPKTILAKLNEAALASEHNASHSYFEQVANMASSIVRKVGRGRRINLPAEPGQDPICIDTALRTVAYYNTTTKMLIRFNASATLPFKTAEAINYYLIDRIEKVAAKIK